jgi:hypothetical protein
MKFVDRSQKFQKFAQIRNLSKRIQVQCQAFFTHQYATLGGMDEQKVCSHLTVIPQPLHLLFAACCCYCVAHFRASIHHSIQHHGCYSPNLSNPCEDPRVSSSRLTYLPCCGATGVYSYYFVHSMTPHLTPHGSLLRHTAVLIVD